ncbi:hypothetical protein [Endozoicomonas sp. ONNA2]|uniref:hypothetical protein n=1 Tax=Endozoicomonas sp. ONNA2 TaxID=2828741 RepID=UPI00214996E9|nr:hypothetical protein [Endozoicomonas sp. ONNA2]
MSAAKAPVAALATRMAVASMVFLNIVVNPHLLLVCFLFFLERQHFLFIDALSIDALFIDALFIVVRRYLKPSPCLTTRFNSGNPAVMKR